MDTGALRNVLSIDTKEMVVTVEAGVTMGELCAATLAKSTVPRVTPEYTTFTVGGLSKRNITQQLQGVLCKKYFVLFVPRFSLR